ncbi:hypothetical protein FLJC2902T_08900 [Flavobacterium limnosediminis JC2902]|uniref:Uncharacterized protein n=1 Tax=Flavobacterium limnosediminis JC2902 TaxID=1341181 RepID=V6SSP3_9FLAO|nr:hypothetical protein [Flavobacterium limnosediminis]ESU29484.1 hypothetical protein FLJC2902T_08900 [Flavobacterium limnosediminis JC2902]
MIIKIENTQSKYSNDIIYKVIKKLLNNDDLTYRGKEIPNYVRLMLIADIVKEITSQELYISTFKLFKKDISTILDNFDKLELLERVLIHNNAPAELSVRIRSYYLSVFIKYDCFLKTLSGTGIKTEELIIYTELENSIYTNIDEIETFFKKSVFLNGINTIPGDTRVQVIGKIINDLSGKEYLEDIDYRGEIKYLNTIKERTFEIQKEVSVNENPFPKVFCGADEKNYLLFKIYSERYIIDRYADYSFLIQKMKKEERIIPITHSKLMEWLFENDFISEKTHQEFLNKESFSTKYSSAGRENNYNLIVKEIFELK